MFWGILGGGGGCYLLLDPLLLLHGFLQLALEIADLSQVLG